MKIATLILIIIPQTIACRLVVSITQYANNTEVYETECESGNVHYSLSLNTTTEEQLNEEKQPGLGNKYDGSLVSKGNKALLVVRVATLDANTSYSATKLSQSVFGQGSAKSQYSACSFNQLNFHPAIGDGVSKGVIEITILQNITKTSRNVIQNAITEKLGGKPLYADHVMYCLPPGTSGGWIAYAYVNHWLSVYNDKWCTYLSGQMHEIGHNLGLEHSGEATTPYGDQSGYMGYSYGHEKKPLMCFNGPKSWQLGWYANKTYTINTTKREKYEGGISGIVDYTTSTLPVIIRIKEKDKKNYFVMYNKKANFNVDTKEGADQVLVTTAIGDELFGPSTLLAKLDIGQSLKLPNNYTINTTTKNEKQETKITINPARCSSEQNCNPPLCKITTENCLDIKSLLKAPRPNTTYKNKYKSSTTRQRNFTH